MLLGNRYYDCSVGRFISQDPAQDESNWYSYCGNNPLVATDPSGLESITLPDDPSGLPKGWSKDAANKNPNGEKWISPNGDEGLEFHRAQKGAKGWEGKDHWHETAWNPDSKGGKGGWDKDKKHLAPGSTVNVKSSISAFEMTMARTQMNGALAIYNAPAATKRALVAIGSGVDQTLKAIWYVLSRPAQPKPYGVPVPVPTPVPVLPL